VNLIGSFLIGFVMQAAPSIDALSPTVRLALTAGVLGGFTTYSAFSYETTRQFQTGAAGAGALNIVLTTAGCLLACLLGLACAKWALQP
jgi:CrcB protein